MTTVVRMQTRRVVQENDRVDGFTISIAFTATNPLYMETASQLGLLKDPSIPLVPTYVLDEAAPAAT
jgi:hypothetical protein